MSTWQEGEYPATTKAGTVYEKDGKLLFGGVFDVGGNEMKAYFVLITADGAVNTKTIDKMKEWSNWDGTDPYQLIEIMQTGIDVSVTIKNEPGYKDSTKVFPKIQWVNAVGQKSSMPEAGDREKILMKFGSKLRAAAGPVAPKPVTQTATTPAMKPVDAVPPTTPTAPFAKPAPKAPTKKAPAHSCLEECWKLCQDTFPCLDEDALAEKWYSFIDATGMDQATMTGEGWDTVKQAITAVKDDCPL